MAHDDLLQHLERAAAAQLVIQESADLFAFLHALTREAVYTTLLLRERRDYHRAIGETIERLYAPAPESPAGSPAPVSPVQAGRAQVLGDLAYHFYEAGAWDKALEYSRRAGEMAQRLFAPREALGHFARAIKAAEQLGGAAPSQLYRARGEARETIGDFDAARADYEQAGHAARAAHDRIGEWQSLVDLGALWAGRDYREAGPFLLRAAELGQTLDRPELYARSLNRLGNWLLNVGQDREAFQAHREALAIFQAAQDKTGTAETTDLLAMANLMSGDELAARAEYQKADRLFRELGDKRGLVSSLTAGANVAHFDEPVITPVPDLIQEARTRAEAFALAREIGWLAGQAFAEWSAGYSLATQGEFGAGLAHAREGLRIAVQIEHRQWTAAACYALGHIYALLLQPEPAIEYLERGLALARELDSAWWTGNISAFLALAHLLRHDHARAASVLAAAPPREHAPHNFVERRSDWAQAQLALAEHRPAATLRMVDQLIESAPGVDRSRPVPALLLLRGEALLALDRSDEAEQALKVALQASAQRHASPLLWQIHRALGTVYRRAKRAGEAVHEFAAARAIVAALAATIDEADLRARFARAALRTLPDEDESHSLGPDP